MNKYIKTLLLTSVMMTATQAFSANIIDDFNHNTNKIKLKTTDSITINREGKSGRTILDDVVDHTRSKENVSKLTTKYNEKKSFAKWKQEIHDYISIGSDDVIYTIYKNNPQKEAIYKEGIEYSIAAAEIYMADLWNELIPKNPKSKNMRAAFCEAGKEALIVSNKAVCNKDFQLNKDDFHFYKKRNDNSIGNIVKAPKIP